MKVSVSYSGAFSMVTPLVSVLASHFSRSGTAGVGADAVAWPADDRLSFLFSELTLSIFLVSVVCGVVAMW